MPDPEKTRQGAAFVDTVYNDMKSLSDRIKNLEGNDSLGMVETIDISGNTLRIRTARVPASASAPGNTGEIAWGSSFLYICIAPNTWRRIAHATW